MTQLFLLFCKDINANNKYTIMFAADSCYILVKCKISSIITE